GAAGVEGHPADGGAADRAAVPRDDAFAVVVRVDRRNRRARAVQTRADVQVRALVAGLRGCTLVARPAEVRDTARGRGLRGRGLPVDLFPPTPALVPDPEVIGAGPDREAERVSETLGDDAPRDWI